MLVFEPMSKESQPVTLEILLRDVPDCFLGEEETIQINDPKTQKILRKIWDLSTFICPEKTQVSLKVPTLFLVKQELVSPVVAEEILAMPEVETRFNQVTIERTPGGLELTKTHITSQTGLIGGLKVRGDILLEETARLEKQGDIVTISQISKERARHYHIGEVKYVSEPGLKIKTAEKIDLVTSRSLDRLLAVIVQGLSPGYFD